MLTRLPHRAVIEIQGKDRAAFLQGLITNDIHLVTPEKVIYALMLTPQGRFLYDFFIQENEGSYLVDVEARRLEEILKKLSLYKLRSEVTLTPRPDLAVYALWGEETQDPGKSFDDPRLPALGMRGFCSSEAKIPTSAEDYELHCLTLGVPEEGRGLVYEKSIPLESGMDELNAISWTKGCYMGQELTARTKHRGLVRKRLFPVQIEGVIPQDGTPILQGEQGVGEMRTHLKNQGIAMLRLEAMNKEVPFSWGGSVIKPYSPEWMCVVEPS